MTTGTVPSQLSSLVKDQLKLDMDIHTKVFVEWLPWNLMQHDILSYNSNGACVPLLDKYGIKLPYVCSSATWFFELTYLGHRPARTGFRRGGPRSSSHLGT